MTAWLRQLDSRHLSVCPALCISSMLAVQASAWHWDTADFLHSLFSKHQNHSTCMHVQKLGDSHPYRTGAQLLHGGSHMCVNKLLLCNLALHISRQSSWLRTVGPWAQIKIGQELWKLGQLLPQLPIASC